MKTLFFILSLFFVPFAYAQTPTSIDFKNLNFNDSFLIVKGSGAKKLALFEDPNCPYCKQFENTLSKLNNVTLYIFLYPILGEESINKSTSIWCSKNRTYTWQNWMINHVDVSPQICNTTPVYRNLALGKMLGFNGTPTIIFEDGTKEIGNISSEQIEAKFSTLYKNYKPIPLETLKPKKNIDNPPIFNPFK